MDPGRARADRARSITSRRSCSPPAASHWRGRAIQSSCFNFVVDVPKGATEIAADLDLVLPASGQFSGGGTATARLGLLSWNHVLLYPDGKTSDDLRYRASVTFPKGWKVVSPLEGKTSGDRTEFAETSLTTLVDSPVQAGVYVRQYELGEVTARRPQRRRRLR